MASVTARNQSIPTLLQVGLALGFYATGSFFFLTFFYCVGDFTGLHKVSSELVNAKQLPLFPTKTPILNPINTYVFALASFPNVVEAVDGTRIRIQAPITNENQSENRKGFHSINI